VSILFLIMLLLAFYGVVIIKAWMFMRFFMLRVGIVKSDKSEISRASRKMLLFHFNE